MSELRHNRIIQHYHRTHYLSTGQVERVTRVLPRPKQSWLKKLFSLFTDKKP